MPLYRRSIVVLFRFKRVVSSLTLFILFRLVDGVLTSFLSSLGCVTLLMSRRVVLVTTLSRGIHVFSTCLPGALSCCIIFMLRVIRAVGISVSVIISVVVHNGRF